MKKIIMYTFFALTSFQLVSAEDIHLETLKRSQELMEERPDGISLEQAKELAAGENVDARIAYEKLYQAHQRIHQARANYFPYGAGDVAALYITNFWNPLILAEMVTSVPSKWYNVQRFAYLMNAEAHRLKSLKANLRNQVAKFYYGVLKEETVLALTGLEIRLLEELVRVLEIQAEAGLADIDELEDAERSALKIRDQYLKLKSYLAEEKAALKVVLNLAYDEKDLVFQPVKDLLNQDDISIDLENLALTSLNRSHEVKAAQQVIYAASAARSSEKWSILSFTGLGFNYLERVRYAGSKLDQAIFQKEALERNIESEVYARESALRNSIDFLHSEVEIADNSKRHMLGELESFRAGHAKVNDLIEADLYFVRDFRKVVVAHYNSLSRLDDLERIALGNVEQEFEEHLFAIVSEPYSNGVSLRLEADLDFGTVQSVTYSFDLVGQKDIKSFNEQNGFKVFIPKTVSGHNAKEGQALIILKSGEAVKKEFTITQFETRR